MPPVRLEDAEHELRRLLSREMASLLRQAAGMRVVREELFDVVGSFPLPLQSPRGWRRQVRVALDLAEVDGTRPRGALPLAFLRDRPVARWPAASRLAEAARSVEDSEFARVCLGHALLCEGHAARAERIFAGLVRRQPVLRHRWRVLEGLALAHEALGRHRLALGAIEGAVAEPHCGVSALVQGLHLALRAGDAERARRAAARIDLLVDPLSPSFGAALSRLRRRVARFDGALSPYPEDSIRDLLEDLLRADRSPVGHVARALA